jgi:hypothetical protein
VSDLAIILTIAFPSYAASLLVAYSIGKTRGRTLANRPDYRCSCSHAFGVHDPKTGRCHGSIHHLIDARSVGCPCQRYAGDVPAQYVIETFQSPTLDR